MPFKNFTTKLETKSTLLFGLLCKSRFSRFSKDDIRKYQESRARYTVNYARAHSKFFKEHYSGLKVETLEDFKKLPTVNKKIMMDNLTEYNTVGLTKEEVLEFSLEVEKSRDYTRRLKGLNIGMSSGTSGNKGVEIVSKEEENYMKAALFARFDFPKGEKINLAFILRITTPAFNFDKFGHKLTYVSQRDPLRKIVEQLEEIKPNVLSGPPSMLKILAKEVEKGNLSISPKRIVSYAEILYPDVKEYLAEVFDCAIHEIYKSTEGPIGMTCHHGRLHINEDLVLIEALNNDGTDTTPGEPCERLLVTDLHKKAQPIIRYELNDILTISPNKCECGSEFRVIDNIQGRSDDIFWAKEVDTDEWRYIFPDYMRRAVITSSEDIDEYQVIQNSPEDILVRIQLKDGVESDRFNEEEFVSSVSDSIGEVFVSSGCVVPDVSVVFEMPKANENSKKLIRIHRNFNISRENDEEPD